MGLGWAAYLTTVVAVLWCGPMVLGQAEAQELPPLLLFVDPAIDAELVAKIEVAVQRETGRRVVLRREAGDGTTTADGSVAIGETESGALVIRYRPPDAELERTIRLSANAEETATNVGLVVQHLALRETAPTPASPPSPEPTPCAPARSEPCAAVAAAPPTPWEPLRLFGGARVGGFGITTHGGGQGSANADVGVRLGLQVPWRRLSVGIETGFTHFSADFPSEAGERTWVNAETWDLSALAGFWIVPPGGDLEAEVLTTFGALVPLSVRGLRIGEDSDLGGSYSGVAGYRATAYLRGAQWLGERLAIAAGVGVEYQFSTAHGPMDFEVGPSEEYVSLWHAGPALAVAAIYRFGR